MSKDSQNVQTLAAARGLSVGQMLRRAWLCGIAAGNAQSIITGDELKRIDGFFTPPATKTASARARLEDMKRWARIRAIFMMPDALANSQIDYFWMKMLPLLDRQGGVLLIPDWTISGFDADSPLRRRLTLLQKAGVAKIPDAGPKENFLAFIQPYMLAGKTLLITKDPSLAQMVRALKNAGNLTVCRLARWGYLEELSEGAKSARGSRGKKTSLPRGNPSNDAAVPRQDTSVGENAALGAESAKNPPSVHASSPSAQHRPDLTDRPLSPSVQKPRPTQPTTPAFVSEARLTDIPDIPLSHAPVPRVGDVVTTDRGGKISLLRELASGGEGTVYDVGRDDCVAKIYKPERLTRRRFKKLELMLSRPVLRHGICYPSAILFSRGNFAGFLMPRARGTELKKTVMIPEPVFRSRNPEWRRVELVRLSLAILRHIQYLHLRDILVGDINALNILVVSPDEVYFVDADSYQIGGFPCPVGTNEFIAPELQGRSNFSNFLRSAGNENFAVAVLLFMILLPGRHPYSHLGGGSVQDNIRSLRFPYPLGDDPGGGVPPGKWLKMWRLLPQPIREAFYQSFKPGGKYQRESSRLSVDKWIGMFEKYLSLLDAPPPAGLPPQAQEIFPGEPLTPRKKGFFSKHFAAFWGQFKKRG